MKLRRTKRAIYSTEQDVTYLKAYYYCRGVNDSHLGESTWKYINPNDFARAWVNEVNKGSCTTMFGLLEMFKVYVSESV